MSSRQTTTPSDQSPAGAVTETHWSEDKDFQWRAAEREGADFFLREVEALGRLNVPPVRATWRDAGRIAGILRQMPTSTLRRVARTSNPMALRLMVLFNLQAGYRDGRFDKTISIPRLIHTRTSEYRTEYRTGSAA